MTQAAVMSTIIKSKEFINIKVSRPMQTSIPRTPAQHNTPSGPACRYVVVHIHQGSAKHMARHAWTAARLAISAKYAEVRKPGQLTS